PPHGKLFRYPPKAAKQPRAVMPFGRLRREATKPLAAFTNYLQNSRPLYEGGQVFEVGRLRGRLRIFFHGRAHIHGAANPALVAFTLSALRARLSVRSAMPTVLASASTSFAGRGPPASASRRKSLASRTASSPLACSRSSASAWLALMVTG